MQPGQIMLWFGILADVPSGWHICDGKMNTPDLRNRFVIGAGDSYVPDSSGGSTSHDHLYDGPLHSHTLESGASISSGTFLNKTTDDSKIVGQVDSEVHIPPYKSLVWIMKVN